MQSQRAESEAPLFKKYHTLHML